VAMVKKNVQACLQSSTKAVDFVPYAAGHGAADIQALCSAMRRQASLEGLCPSSKAAAPRMWGMCKAMAFFMTTAAVEVLQVPPIPWVDSCAAGLSQRLWASREAKIQVLNTGYQHCSRRSFVGTGVSSRAAKATIANLVALVKDCVSSVEKIAGQTPICPSKYFGLLASHGQPALGYVQKCAVVLSEGAEVQDLRPLTGSRLLELHGCDSGCAAGMRQITEEEPKQLENKDFLRLRLKLLCKVVRKVWQKNLPEWHGPRESARRPRRRGHWLCNSASGRKSILEKRWSARGLSSSR